jgi:vancomycin resistance protein YoaR
MSKDKVRGLVRAKVKEFSEANFQIAARGIAKTITLKDIGITLNDAQILEEIPFAGEISNAEMLFWSFAGKRIMPKPIIEETEILRLIDEKFPDIPKAKNAYFEFKNKKLQLVEAKNGVMPNLEPLIYQIQNSVAFLEHSPLLVNFTEAEPTLFIKDLEPYKDPIAKRFSYPFKLVYEKDKWAVDFGKNPQWIVFEKKPYEVKNNELPFVMQWGPVDFSNFLNEKISKSLEQAPESIKIWRDPNGKIIFEGNANEGRAIERDRLLALVNMDLEQMAPADPVQEVEIPLVVVPPKVDISQDLQDLGIRELVAVGHTAFAGSPANRAHNISVGISKFNGLLIPPGAVFSFDDNLGFVDGSTGYRKELVIKPEGTIPEFGGGLCQVSTTLYRAAIYGGFPIVDRTPHTYAVSYYSQIGGHGLDATIYPPTRDMKFKNDTAGNLLIQSYVNGVDAYFKLYGMSDGRKITMEGPYISNRKSAPSEIITVKDPTMKPGEKKQVEKPHGGFDVMWYRYITKNGETKKEDIFTRYQATQAKFLTGDELTPEGENAGIVQPANQEKPKPSTAKPEPIIKKN